MLTVVLALAATLFAAPAAAAETVSADPVVVRDVVVDAQSTGTTVWIRTSRQARYKELLVDNPSRLVIDVAEATFAWDRTRLLVGSVDVREIRGSQFRPGIARVVIELARETSYTIEPGARGIRVTIGRAQPKPFRESRQGTQAVPGQPFPERQPPAGAQPRLQGIVIRDGGAVAYIQNPRTNGVAGYKIGDEFAGSVLETIGEDHVVLKGPTDTVVLRIAPLPRKKP